MPPPRPSFPSESRPRRLGTGGAPGGGERLLRTQLIIAFILGTTILAVLLYLWRRPSAAEHDARDVVPEPSASAAPAAPAIVRTPVTPKEKTPVARVKIGAVQHLKCGSSARNLTGESSLCDALPFFEQALAKALDEKVDCVPKAKDEGSINYVVAVDFRTHDVRVYPGRSGTWHGKQAKAAAECVKKALPAPTWDTMIHQYRYYVLALLATYPKQTTEEALPNFQ
ncbi:MAG TPA: hypothetical protein VHU80_08450 [Polyangiaceae bacterium]|jgi:hypothetical protein|nr:hypothetical protein [Polyangiaceae bacterium]